MMLCCGALSTGTVYAQAFVQGDAQGSASGGAPVQGAATAPGALPPLPNVDLSDLNADAYFDSEDLTPPLEGESNPDYEMRVLNPDEDKASRFVVVDKDYRADSVEARLAGAKRAMDIGRYEAAVVIYKGLKDEKPKDPAVLIGYAAALQQVGREDEAISTYETVLKLEPDNLDAHINMLGLIGNRYPAVALQRLKALEAKVQTFNPSLIGQIAFTQARLGYYNEALKSYGVLVGRDPHNAEHLLNMAIVADKAGLEDKAISYYEQALEVDSIYSGGRVLDRDQIFDRLAQLR